MVPGGVGTLVVVVAWASAVAESSFVSVASALRDAGRSDPSGARMIERPQVKSACAAATVCSVRPHNTTDEAHQAQLDAWRRMGPETRVRVAFEMSEDVRRMAAEGIRARHPDYDDERIRRALFRLLLGEALVRAIWPGEAVVAP